MSGPYTATFPGGGYDHIPGVRNVINVTNPGAGNEWSILLGQGYYWRLLCGQATLTTSAVVANRFPGIQLFDSNVNLFTLEVQAAVVASTTVTVTYVGGVVATPTVVNTPDFLIGGPAMWIEPGYTLRSVTPGKDPGDAYTAINLWFEQLDPGPMGEPMRVHHRTWEQEHDYLEKLGQAVGQIDEHAPTGQRG